MLRFLFLLHRIGPARAPTLLVGVLLLLLVARDASNDMVASLAESPRAGLGFQLLLLGFAAGAAFAARVTLAAASDATTAGAFDATIMFWWPRALFGAVAATGAIVSLRSAADGQASLCAIWAAAGIALIHWRDRRAHGHAAIPFGAAGRWVAGAGIAAGLAGFVLAAAESYGLKLGIDLPALVSAIAPRAGAAVFCLLLIMGPLTAATLLADRYKFRREMKLPVLTLGGATLLVAAQILPLHQGRTAPRPGPAGGGRVGLDAILASYVATCGGGAAADAPVRPVVVALSGGASRAALWGARVLRDVDAAAADAHTAVFALSSVSGGSLGAAAYVALRRDDVEAARNADTDTRCHLARSPARDAALVAHLRADMLGPLLVGTVLDDSARALLAPLVALTGAAIPRGGDRAEALERGFSRAWGHGDGAPGWHGFEENFLSFFYRDDGAWRDGMPIWITNGTDVRNGSRLLTSPVRALAGVPRSAGVVDDPGWP